MNTRTKPTNCLEDSRTPHRARGAQTYQNPSRRVACLAACALLLSITAFAADKDKAKGRFSPGPAASYPNKQTNEKVTIAAEPYETTDEARTAFGKVNPYEHGVLPVLLVIQNDTGKTISLEQLEVVYVTPGREHIDAIPAKDVAYLEGPKRPNFGGPPLPIPIPRGAKKSKLAIWEIEGRALNAKMIPAGESAHGFVYFQTGHRKGSKIYLKGITEAGTGRELFYFEIPLEE